MSSVGMGNGYFSSFRAVGYPSASGHQIIVNVRLVKEMVTRI